MNPSLENISHRTPQPQSREALRREAAEKARNLLAENSLQEESFIEDGEGGGVYAKEQVEAHLKEVARLEAIWEEEKNSFHENQPNTHKETVKQAGDTLEGIIFDATASWFSDGVETPSAIKTSKFDDYKNGIDLVIELESGKKPLALAVDVTFGFKGLQKKTERILRDIDSGRLGFMRYFRSSDGSFEGKLGNLPRVVVGLEMDEVENLSKVWLEEGSEPLKDHYAGTLIISEIYIQLRTYAKYAASVGQDAIAKILDTEREKIETILASKKDEHMNHVTDRVYGALLQVMMGIEREIGERNSSQKK
jgi:hypothetical protein